MLLSAILIVKNEEKRLARCLEPLRRVGCEIVVTDTGSTDRTVEIAKEFGAHLCYFPWNGDEAAARNVSLREAKGKWVFWVDADEITDDVLVESLKRDLPRWDAEPSIQTLAIVMRNLYQGGSTSLTPLMRLARRREDLQFEGVIHPQLNFRQRCETLKGILVHEGYQWTPELRKRKSLHMRAHLEPLCQGETPPFHRWCEWLSVLLIGDDRPAFEGAWKKKEKYSEEVRYRGPYAHYWQDNTTNVLLYFSRLERWEEGRELAEELCVHYPQQIAPHFYLLQEAVHRRSWEEVLVRATDLEKKMSGPAQFYNTYYPEIQGETTQVWKMIAEAALYQQEMEKWSTFLHPRHGAAWIYSVVHFRNYFKAQNKWQEVLVRWIEEWKNQPNSSEKILLSLQKIREHFLDESIEKMVSNLLEIVLMSQKTPESRDLLKKTDDFVLKYSEIGWISSGFEQMSPRSPIQFEWFYERGLHRV